MDLAEELGSLLGRSIAELCLTLGEAPAWSAKAVDLLVYLGEDADEDMHTEVIAGVLRGAFPGLQAAGQEVKFEARREERQQARALARAAFREGLTRLRESDPRRTRVAATN